MCMTAELSTIIDFIRYGASRFAAAGLSFSHNHDNALDEATHLVLQTLHLPHDLSPAYGQARLTGEEKAALLGLFERRIKERTRPSLASLLIPAPRTGVLDEAPRARLRVGLLVHRL